MKNKTVAASLALLMGIFGVHRFYLGQRFLGILHLTFFIFMMVLSFEEEAPFIMAPLLLGFIDAVLLFVMPDEEFNEKYNRRWLGGNRSRQPSYAHHYDSYPSESAAYSYGSRVDRQTLKRRGIDRFRAYDFAGAVAAFEDCLEEDFEDASVHFNLACSYSMLENSDRAFYHLEQAVGYGFTNLDKIHRHEALTFLRAMPEFDDFAANGYRRVEALPPAPPAIPSKPRQQDTDDLLEQIIKLGDLREKGILTEQEFTRQKKKLLGE